MPIHHPGRGEVTLGELHRDAEKNQAQCTQPPAAFPAKNHDRPGSQGAVGKKVANLVAIADVDFDIRRRDHRQHDAQ
jgi:hypothetical protein